MKSVVAKYKARTVLRPRLLKFNLKRFEAEQDLKRGSSCQKMSQNYSPIRDTPV